MYIIFDIVLLLLVSICVVYCWQLSRQIKDLQSNKNDFLKMIKYFDSAIDKANESIKDLNELNKEVNTRLSSSINEASATAEDLKFTHEVSNAIIARLEESMRSARDLERKLSENSDYERSENHDERSEDRVDSLDSGSYDRSNMITTNTINGPKNAMRSHGYLNYFDTLRKLDIKKS